MMERPARGYFGGLWVFPGGGLEDIDDSPLARAAVAGAGSDHRWRAAALRETVEEVGLALTTPATDGPLDATGSDVFREVLAHSSRLDGASLHFLSQWVTPPGAPSRFDVRFYLTVVEGDPPLAPRPSEAVDACWVAPDDALGRAEAGELAIVTPTLRHLRWLDRHRHVDAAVLAASGSDVLHSEPHVGPDGSHVTVGLPQTVGLT